MSLDDLRVDIDRLDAEIAERLAARGDVAARIGLEKRRLDLSVQDSSRESKVLDRVGSVCRGAMTPDEMKRIYQEIIAVCSSIQARDNQD